MFGMEMTGSNGIFSVPSEHLPGLIALVGLSPLLWIILSSLHAKARAGSARASRLLDRYDALSFTARAVMLPPWSVPSSMRPLFRPIGPIDTSPPFCSSLMRLHSSSPSTGRSQVGFIGGRSR